MVNDMFSSSIYLPLASIEVSHLLLSDLNMLFTTKKMSGICYAGMKDRRGVIDMKGDMTEDFDGHFSFNTSL